MIEKCNKCGHNIKLIKWKCFNCEKEQTQSINKNRTLNYDLQCCLTCVFKIINKTRKQMAEVGK